MVTVALPAAVRPFCGGHAEVKLAAGDVRSLLDALARAHPEAHRRLCDEQGLPRPHINVFINEEHVRARRGLDTQLTAGDVVTILPAVSGG